MLGCGRIAIAQLPQTVEQWQQRQARGGGKLAAAAAAPHRCHQEGPRPHWRALVLLILLLPRIEQQPILLECGRARQEARLVLVLLQTGHGEHRIVNCHRPAPSVAKALSAPWQPAHAGTPFQSQFNPARPQTHQTGAPPAADRRAACTVTGQAADRRLSDRLLGAGQVRGHDPELSPIARRPADPSKETAPSPSADSRAAAAAAGPLQAGSGKPTHVVHPGGGAILPAGI